MREKLTLILFKDHLTSRTLKFPVQWLPRFGLLWIGAMGLTVATGGILLRSYLRGQTEGGFSHASQDKIEDLEKQLSELKASYDALQSRSQGGTVSVPTLADPTSTNFTALPATSLRSGLPPRETLPFRLEPMKAQWRGNTLQLSTAIEYIRDDGGNQQGHFVILARGPQNLFAYPDGALSPSGHDTLIKPESGEYFSVSRYREIRANFGPVLSRDAIQSVELMVFDSKKNLIFIERLAVESPRPKPKPTPPASAEPPAAAAPAPAPAAPAQVESAPATTVPAPAGENP